MVIVKLTQGLGNQLFQYAAARRLSHVHRTTLKLDITFFETPRLFAYSLHPFNIQEVFASPEELAEIKESSRKGRAGMILRLRQKLKLSRRWTIIHEDHLRPFNSKVMDASGNVYLQGYWQSAKYFADIEDIIRREFTIRYEQDAQSREIAEMIAATQSVSIHVRRSDLVSDPRTRQVHGICSLEYYQQCVRRIAERIAYPHFFVFSDDPPWAKENLRLEHPTTFVTHNDATRDYEDLRLTSMCKHHIIANSTFSWWAAWLNTNPDKIVFAPRKWLNRPVDTRDLIPEGWIRV